MGRWTHQVKSGLEELGHHVEAWFEEQFPAIRATGRLAVLLFPLALAVRLLAPRSNYDLVLIHEPGGFWYGMAKRLFPRAPRLVAMCHNVESHVYHQMLDYSRRSLATVSPGTRVRSPLFRLWQSNGTIRLADGVVCLSS